MKLFRRHDRYVLRAFWTTFVAVLLFFTVIVVVLDATERIRKLTRNWDQVDARGQHPLLVLGEYYLTFLPFLWMKLLAFCAPAASIFCLSRLNLRNELLPLASAGVPVRRIALPIALSGLVIAGLVLVVQETVVPPLNRRYMRLARIVMDNSPDRVVQVPHYHDPGGGRLSMQAYLPLQQRMEAVSITFRDEATGALKDQYWFPELAWDEDRGQWLASHGGSRMPAERTHPGSQQALIGEGESAPLTASATLIELSLLARFSAGLSYAQMSRLAAANPGSPHLAVLKHELLTAPLATFILTLLSLPLSFRISSRIKSAIPGVIGMLLLAGLYFGAQILVGRMARAGEFNPVVLAWLPTVLFGSLALAALLTMDD